MSVEVTIEAGKVTVKHSEDREMPDTGPGWARPGGRPARYLVYAYASDMKVGFDDHDECLFSDGLIPPYP